MYSDCDLLPRITLKELKLLAIDNTGKLFLLGSTSVIEIARFYGLGEPKHNFYLCPLYMELIRGYVHYIMRHSAVKRIWL